MPSDIRYTMYVGAGVVADKKRSELSYSGKGRKGGRRGDGLMISFFLLRGDVTS